MHARVSYPAGHKFVDTYAHPVLNPSTSAQLTKARRVLIAARAGDPLVMEGRARLIWAANTAEASSGLGANVWLACQGAANSLFAEDALPLIPPTEAFCRFYGVDGSFEVLASPVSRWRRLGGKKLREAGNWEANTYLPQYVLPRVDAVQTRDFRLACHSVRQGIPTIYEDHNESYHTAIRRFPQDVVSRPAFRLAVATTEAVRQRLVQRGMPSEKAIVAWSGLNAASLKSVARDELMRIREQFLNPGHRSLVTYAGGLHACRGVELILKLAADCPEVTFLIMGGRQAHVRNLRREAQRRRLNNFHVLGYLPQTEVPAFLQASDAVLMPYSDHKEARITSPLKFFEYLASGTPVVAARLPELEGFQQISGLGVDWCGISDYACFRFALSQLLERAESRQHRHSCNREVAAEYTWTQRQRRIFAAAGLDVSADGTAGVGRRREAATNEALAMAAGGLSEMA